MLWRGSLLPLDSAAGAGFIRGASHPSASKLARHNKLAPTVKGGVGEEVDHPRFHLLIFAQSDHCPCSTLRLPTPYQSSLRVSTITVPSRPNSNNEPINSA
ncbi:hypothetical protein FJ692_25530 [Pseudomonas fluorescens]|nr:hypothetical protein FJ692_25530 [Pseudomonas fluorescens]